MEGRKELIKLIGYLVIIPYSEIFLVSNTHPLGACKVAIKIV